MCFFLHLKDFSEKWFCHLLERAAIMPIMNSSEIISKWYSKINWNSCINKEVEGTPVNPVRLHQLYYWQFDRWAPWLTLKVYPRINWSNYSSPRFCHSSSGHYVAKRGYTDVEINHQTWKEKDKIKWRLEFSNEKLSSRILFSVVGGQLASCHKDLDSNILMELSRRVTRMFVYKRK